MAAGRSQPGICPDPRGSGTPSEPNPIQERAAQVHKFQSEALPYILSGGDPSQKPAQTTGTGVHCPQPKALSDNRYLDIGPTQEEAMSMETDCLWLREIPQEGYGCEIPEINIPEEESGLILAEK
ncbi:hypothetical protein H920_02599 [Fukomys damarensis]|uniref:Uncharacterized protein n=1 Tax=Fukomys damarensis TaxID=885580 RepID=A0A091DV09_FUKDA|nr:hypothetical protein H920_02599 [Fukomys damarensis]